MVDPEKDQGLRGAKTTSSVQIRQDYRGAKCNALQDRNLEMTDVSRRGGKR